MILIVGWYGLGAAKRYYCQHPHENIAIIDYSSSVGGVWAKSRLYPSLKSNNLLGTFEYPDFPMDTNSFGVKSGQHIPGEVIQAYQEAYARKFGILDSVRLNTKVISAEHSPEGGWLIVVRPSTDEQSKEPLDSAIFTKRLIIATGVHSEPFMPHIRGQESFGKPLFHAKAFRQHLDTIDPLKRVTVFGGTKFAWDAVYAYALAGAQVDWIIRGLPHVCVLPYL